MPTYDYQCTKCGHRFELFQSIKAEPAKACPICQGPVERLLGTGGGMIFKGSGFYITDHRSKSYTEKAKQESSATSSGGEKAATTKSETKSEAKTPTKTATGGSE
jgi:putative FmdB family regulatory protein